MIDIERIDPSRSSLVIVDVQNDFCAEGGWFHATGYDMSMIHDAVGRLQSFLPGARAAGIAPIFVQAIYDREFLSEAMLERLRRNELDVEHCLQGSWGAEFYELQPEPEDQIVVKHRYSAFINTELDKVLRGRKTENVLLAGITSNVCVESTARDGFMLDYHVVVIEDCMATYEKRFHDMAIENIERSFGIVADSKGLIEAWQQHGFLKEHPL